MTMLEDFTGRRALASLALLVSAGCDIDAPERDASTLAREAGVDHGAPDATPCEPTPVDDVDGAPTGYVSCGADHFDRVEALACPPHPTGFGDAPCDSGGECRTGADCPGTGDTRCLYINGECGCRTFCRTDADCGDGEACLCRAVVPTGDARGSRTLSMLNICVRAGCRTGADCAGGACGLTVNDCGPGGALACRTAGDTCRTDDDCPAAESCAFDAEAGRWICQGEATCE